MIKIKDNKYYLQLEKLLATPEVGSIKINKFKGNNSLCVVLNSGVSLELCHFKEIINGEILMTEINDLGLLVDEEVTSAD